MLPTKRPASSTSCLPHLLWFQAEDEAKRPAAEAGSVSEDVWPDISKTVALSTSVKKENNKVLTKSKGKGKVVPLWLVEEGTETPSFETQTVCTDTPLMPVECELYISQCRTAHHEEAYQDGDKANNQCVESGLKHSPVVAEYVVEAFRHTAEVEEALQAVPDVEGNLVFVQSVVAKFCKVNHHTPLPPSADIWAHIPPPALVETSERTTVALLSYLLVYPANSANTLLQLLLQDEDITFVHSKFWESMSLMILKALLIFSSTPSDLTQISLAWPQNTYYWITIYAPVTFVNFLSSTPTLAYSVYHILCLNMPTTASSNLRTNPVIGDKEHILSAILGGSALNSAPGSDKPIFQLTAEMIAIQDHLTASLLPIDFLLCQEQDEALERRIKSLIDDEVQLLGPCYPTKMAPAAIQSVKSQVASVLQLKRGRLVHLNIAKDITLEGML
ncbi:hypothetical protein B0H14DRAFT_2654424, partial [Mycena olivaceomarginata]